LATSWAHNAKSSKHVGARGGPDGLRLATVCGVAGKGEALDIVPRFLVTGRRVAGSSFGGVEADQVPQFVERHLAGEIDVDAFVSHKLTVDEVNRGFELIEAHDGIRSVIDFALVGEATPPPSRRSGVEPQFRCAPQQHD
jgi:Zn-dependent alcohol dehydrogenase